MDDNLSMRVIPVLEKHNVYYEKSESGEICVSTADFNALKTAMNEFYSSNIPENRSVSADEELMRRYKMRFVNDQIQFEEYELQGSVFYVWQDKDSKAVQKIITEEIEKYKSELE